ncbi:putative phospholipase B-like 2 [Ixodes scapularis]|uniref:putative phospholipase B-like 2 n=1 Tax=Ixodes scapularis TaxID=6945 RepID=UPI001A9EB3F3|nr:putative phospholipase B-like 2 [Ixodes scapularis]XP_029839870.2 putative phospholipase B-like 2 [Ixodes scapularis]
MLGNLAIPLLLVLQVAGATTKYSKCQYAWASVGKSGDILQIHDGKPGPGAVAWGSFESEIHFSGWAFLNVESNASYADEIQAYAAGAVEAHLTRDLMEKHYNNMYADYCKMQPSFCGRLEKFLLKNLEYSNRQERLYQSTDPYWHMVHLQMKQLSGLSDIFENKTLNVSNEYLNVTKALYFNLDGDLIGLVGVVNKNSYNSIDRAPTCSALIKVVGENEDILVGHNTWFVYRSMLRIEKRYAFPWHYTSKSSEIIPGRTVSMSSYPGTLVSLDDFYLSSAGLAVTETSLENANGSLWNLVKPDSAPLTWVRGMVATRLATNGSLWVSIFGRLNSGTYNNQWMVLDYKLFTPGKAIAKNTLWILEQMPNLTKSEDLSNYLQKQRYWASYNVAFFPAIFNISGQPDMVKKYGNYYSHDMSARAQIFRREQSKVKDLVTMTSLMRYNNYTHDPASRCNCTQKYNPVSAISARFDLLNPSLSTGLPGVKQKAVGGTDMKLTNYAMFKKLEFVAINGPTYTTDGSVPPFQWSTSGFKHQQHDGHPDKWTFGPTHHHWDTCPIH